MRIHRLSLSNYRGVGSRSVQFNTNGVTVVCGPNETGKSSLAEGLRVVLQELDRTQKRDVLAIQPVHRDRGSEIEVELETGPYRFVYFKRFHRERETRLVVTKPDPVSLNGEAAHNAVLAMLDETLDRQLWDALCIDQGTAGAQPDLREKRALSAALERAAGTVEGGANDTLLAAARKELLLYYTEAQRKPTRALSEPANRLAEATQALATAEEELADVESAASRAAELSRELAALRAREADAEREAGDTLVQWEAVRVLAQERDAKAADLARAERDVLAVRSEQEHRAALFAQCRRAEHSLEEARELEARARTQAEQNERSLTTLDVERARLEAEASRANALLELRAADLAYAQSARRRDELRERTAALVGIDETRAATTAGLDEARIDEGALERIRRAQDRVVETRAQRDASAPRVTLEALRSLELEIDGEQRSLDADARLEHAVEDRLSLRIGDVATLEIAAGEPLEEARQRVHDAETELDRLCKRGRVRDLAEAERSFDARRALELQIARLTEREQALLGTDTRADLGAELRELETETDAYPRTRVREPSRIAEAEAAGQAHESAAQAYERAWKAHSKAELAFDLQQTGAEDERKRAPALAERVREATEALTAATRALEAARAERAEDALATAAEDSLRRQKQRAHAVAEAEQKLGGVDPVRVEAQARQARETFDELRDTRAARHEEWTRLDAILADRGERGLAERVDRLGSEVHFAQRERERIERRARAASLLHDVLISERDRTRRSYQTPLRERIESLGRQVFGESLRVDLDEDLSIRSRTLDAQTVPWQSLSAGAREQLSLITRLACAMLVSQEDGVPLILDDALAHSDPERAARIGRVLALAGRHCQVIVLTCAPEHYTDIDGAQRVLLS